jgi:hypothetical protein
VVEAEIKRAGTNGGSGCPEKGYGNFIKTLGKGLML